MAEAQQDLGQHLLHDKRAIDRVLAAAELRPGERVLDAGAGTGALTRPMTAAVGPKGRIYAVEIDPAMVEDLRADKADNVRVVDQSLLEVVFPTALDAVVANPPFKIAAPFLERVAIAGVPRAVLVLPRELVDRLVAPPGSERYGKLTVRMALLADVEDLGQVSRHAFVPPPAVACGLVRMRARSDAPVVNPDALDQVLDAARGAWGKKAKGAFDVVARNFRADSAALTKLLKDEGWAHQRTGDLPPEAFAAVARFLGATGAEAD